MQPGLLKRWGTHLALFAAYCLGLVLAEFCGFDFQFTTDEWQLLTPDALAHDAARSLWLLHSQPPLLNLVTAVILKTEANFAIPAVLIAKVLFASLGLGTLFTLFASLRIAGLSRLLAAAGAGLLLTDPAFWVYQNLLFYPMIVVFLFSMSTWFLMRYMLRGRMPDFAGFAASVVTISYCRSLYHPGWAGLTIAGAAILRSRCTWPPPAPGDEGTRARNRRRTLVVVLSAVALLCLWPTKNLILFGQWSYSTWTCYNFRTSPSPEKRALRAYIHNGAIPDSVQRELDRFKLEHGYRSVPAIDEPAKQDGSRNWNHYIFVVANRGAWSRAWSYIASEPAEYLADSFANYASWSCPTYRDSYTNDIEGPNNFAYRRYANAHRAALFPYIGSDSGALSDSSRKAVGRGRRVTLFGLVVFPLLLIGACCRITGSRSRRDWSDSAVVSMLVFWVLWNLLVPALTDATEISRMRFDMTSVLIVLAACMVPRSVGGRGCRGTSDDGV